MSELLHNLLEVSTDLFRYPGGPRQLLKPDAKSETMQSYCIVPPLLFTTQAHHCKTHHNIHALTNYRSSAPCPSYSTHTRMRPAVLGPVP